MLVANNDYSLDLLSLGERERLDEGKLHLYVPHGFRRITWEERSCTELEIGSPLPRLRAAVDGEPVELETPLELPDRAGRATRARAARARVKDGRTVSNASSPAAGSSSGANQRELGHVVRRLAPRRR